jgi:hypothetical protein
MSRILLTSVAVLFLATGTTRAQSLEAWVLILTLSGTPTVIGEYHGADPKIQCMIGQDAAQLTLETAFALWRPPYASQKMRTNSLQCKPKS